MYLPIIKPVFRSILRILSFILFLLTVIAAYGGRINPVYFPYPSWLTLALPYFAMASIVVIIAWLASGKLFTAGVGVVALIAAWGPISTVLPLKTSQEPEDKGRTFSVLTYNILHGEDQNQTLESQKGNPSFEYVIHSGADIVALQEIYQYNNKEIPNWTAYKDSINNIYPYQSGTTDYDRKVLSKYPIKELKANENFSLHLITTPWGKLNLINMHIPSYALSDNERMVISEIMSVKKSEDGLKELKGSIRQKLNEGLRNRAKFAEELKELIETTSGPLIVCGDLNDVPESYAYRKIRSTGLEDAYVQTGFGHMITYNRHGFYFHIDQILYRPDPLKALSISKGKLSSSDHYPVMAEFEWMK